MDKEARAADHLVSRNVDVLKANAHGIWATVRGTSTVHRTKLEYKGGVIMAWCDCAHPTHGCSHVAALSRIWVPKP